MIYLCAKKNMKTPKKQVVEFEQIVEKGCGMDVHKETVVATVSGIGIIQETRTFNTFTSSLMSLLRKVISSKIGIMECWNNGLSQ